MSSPDLKFWLGLLRFQQFGAVRIGKFMRAFPNMERAFFASATDLLELGLDAKLINRFLQERLHIHPDEELEKVLQEGITPITRKDENYPTLLNQLFDPPAVLFVRGTLPSSNLKHIAVVGSRHHTPYGARAVEKIVKPLAVNKVVIVSGLAYGIDALAHQATLDVKGITIAVLGSGIDQSSIYPSGNRALASQILANNGAIVSEFLPGTPPLKGHFPFRNRIIAGMSHGTLVIEAAQKSGSLITARAALEAGRDVYAVPGPIDSLLSEGPNNLLKMGAAPVTEANDIIQITTETIPTFTYEPRNEIEKEILAKLSLQPIHLDELVRATQIPIETISSTMTLLEMKGVIHHEGGCNYTRKT